MAVQFAADATCDDAGFEHDWADGGVVVLRAVGAGAGVFVGAEASPGSAVAQPGFFGGTAGATQPLGVGVWALADDRGGAAPVFPADGSRRLAAVLLPGGGAAAAGGAEDPAGGGP